MGANGELEAKSEAQPHEFTLQMLLDTFDLPAFALNDTGRVVAWGEQISDLLGGSPEEIRGLENLGAYFYDDGRQTLAEKVVQAPERAHERYDDIGLADSEYALLNGDRIYEDWSVIDGRDIWFIATPVYRGEEFIGVVEIVQDLTSSARYEQELETLFAELTRTIEAFADGEFGARVEFDARTTLLEDDYVDIVEATNEMGEAIQDLLAEVTADIERLRESGEEIARRSRDINNTSTDQAESISTISSEVSNLSATVEEIASTTDNVVQTSERAERLAEDGSDTAHEAVDVMEDVAASADEVAGDVDELQSKVSDIDEVVDVINDIAEQTNMLALNASIEAARAGEAGDGFAVVADEVKSLAEDSQDNVSRIEAMVTDIQDETDETVANLRRTTTQIDEGIGQVEDAMEQFESILDAIADTADGIRQVSDATDDQAASAEEIASMVDDAVDKADTISESVDGIVATTDRQTEMVADLERSVDQLTGDGRS